MWRRLQLKLLDIAVILGMLERTYRERRGFSYHMQVVFLNMQINATKWLQVNMRDFLYPEFSWSETTETYGRGFICKTQKFSR